MAGTDTLSTVGWPRPPPKQSQEAAIRRTKLFKSAVIALNSRVLSQRRAQPWLGHAAALNAGHRAVTRAAAAVEKKQAGAPTLQRTKF